VPFPYSKFVDRPIASAPDRISARSHQRAIASAPDRISARSHQGPIASRSDRINARSHQGPIASTPDRINARSLNLGFHPRAKSFHGDVSTGCFALL
jgi:hypothetical protein